MENITIQFVTYKYLLVRLFKSYLDLFKIFSCEKSVRLVERLKKKRVKK